MEIRPIFRGTCIHSRKCHARHRRVIAALNNFITVIRRLKPDQAVAKTFVNRRTRYASTDLARVCPISRAKKSSDNLYDVRFQVEPGRRMAALAPITPGAATRSSLEARCAAATCSASADRTIRFSRPWCRGARRHRFWNQRARPLDSDHRSRSIWRDPGNLVRGTKRRSSRSISEPTELRLGDQLGFYELSLLASSKSLLPLPLGKD